MCYFQFDEVSLAVRLRRIDHSAKIAFSAARAERLLPNYYIFQVKHRWGNCGALREALDLAWHVVGGDSVDVGKIMTAKAAVQRAEPETEDFDSIYVSPALDAAAAVGMVLDLILSDDADIAVAICSLARDTVDMYIQASEALPPCVADLEDRIARHPLMQEELQSQDVCLKELEETLWTPEFVVDFIQRHGRQSKSNIRLP